ncbi:DUF2256 domain-containing protein [Thalassolituus sp.]|uniref:DUF2256 domain-containing protein n=1 Tax=Thalassolituus sp. TaxID=2030822 RepID=UPI002A8386F7|nr:DUF2256 domain-containing protein [Thalassolituus sp.]
MTHHKLLLPKKDCAHCQQPFCWRRKWARSWDEVKYCSERCKRSAKSTLQKTATTPPNLCAAAQVEEEF